MKLHESVFVADGAKVVGEVTVGAGCGIWYNAVLRGDEASITVGQRTNVQDNCVLHGGDGHNVVIGDDVTLGHGAIVHGCTVGDGALIGMGAILLNGSVVGKGALVAAGSLVPEGMEIPPGMLAMGSPAKVRRPVSEKEQAYLLRSALEYAQLAQDALT